MVRCCLFRTIKFKRVVLARSRSTPPFYHYYMTMKWHYIEPIEKRKEKYYHWQVFTRIETVDTENKMLKLKATREREPWVIFWRDDSPLYSECIWKFIFNRFLLDQKKVFRKRLISLFFIQIQEKIFWKIKISIKYLKN